MSDSTPPIPWQHKEFYSIEPMTNQDLDVRCFPTEDSRGREIKDGTHLDQESQALCKKWNLIVRVESILIENQFEGHYYESLLQFSGWKCEECNEAKKGGFPEGKFPLTFPFSI